MMDRLTHALATLAPHSRLRSQASAYADGELGETARVRFEGHLGRCEECAEAVASARTVRSMLASLPLESAPRSFRLTPQMIAPAPVPEPRRSPVPLRVAQLTAGLAAFALVAVFTAGSLGNDSSDRQSSASADTALTSNESKFAPQAAGATASRESAHPQSAADGAAASPAIGATVGAAAKPPATGARSPLASPQTGASEKPLADGGSTFAATETAKNTQGGERAAANNKASNGGVSARRWLEFALLGVLLAAAAAWVAIARKSREEES